MKVTTKSDQPHLRSVKTPYTSATIKVSEALRGKEEQRNLELEFVALLVQALDPRIPMARVIKALSQAVDPNQGFEEFK